MITSRTWTCPLVTLAIILGLGLAAEAAEPAIPLRQLAVPRFIPPMAPRLLRPPAVVPKPPETRLMPIPTRWNATVMRIPTQWDARVVLLKGKP
jgi:hypothetical protein